MHNIETTTESVELVIDGLKNIIAQNKYDLDATFLKLKVPISEYTQSEDAINRLFNGDEELHTILKKELSDCASNSNLLLGAKQGGVTKFVILKKHYIPYGDRLYIDHEMMDKAQNMGQLATAIGACCGPEAVPLILALTVTFTALKVLDRGNGIMVTQIPPFVGPLITTPQ